MKSYVMYVTSDGQRQATRRLTRERYVRRQTTVNIVCFLLGALTAWLCK